MNPSKKLAFAILAALFCLPSQAAKSKTYSLSSPDGRTSISISPEGYDVSHDGDLLIKGAKTALILEDGSRIGIADSKVERCRRPESKSETIDAPFYRQKSFTFPYNRMIIEFKDGFQMEWIASNEGVAYRYLTSRKGKTVIQDETAEFRFIDEARSWLPYSTNEKKPMAMAFQNSYTVQKLSEGSPTLAFLPATVESKNGPKVTILESDVKNYPGMFIEAEGNSIKGVFAQYPNQFDKYRGRQQRFVTGTEEYIAVSEGTRSYPWRIMAITDDDTQMPVNNLVYALAEPSRLSDISWIKPGFSAWEWWNDWNLSGVDFEAGINMDTYHHYIDFASENGLEYMILDEGWYVPSSGDMMTPIAELDIEELVKYAAQRNVRIILWTVFNVLDDQPEAFDKYSKMGVAGFKVDFLDRDDQEANEIVWRLAGLAAEHKMILDLHGISKPVGINRTYPNVLNYESVFGQEEVKWSEVDINMPLYNTTFPFIRLMAGYTDYTPGSMRNASKADFKGVYSSPMTMGTRAHQVATYIVFDSPLTMLCDSPSLYRREQETTDFITSLPRIYESETILSGKIGEYIVTARKNGNSWYVGGLANWDGRTIDLSFDFLGDGEYDVTLYRDGINAGKNAEDYAIEKFTVDRKSEKQVVMQSGGGFAMTVTPKR